MSERDLRLRHKARQAALQILYQHEIGRVDLEEAIATIFGPQWVDEGEPPPEVREFASQLTRDTIARLPEIDARIERTSERWRPERMPVLDRLILRQGICELLRKDGTPPAVVINEALELARTFSSEESVKFVNGMLDAIRKQLEAETGN